MALKYRDILEPKQKPLIFAKIGVACDSDLVCHSLGEVKMKVKHAMTKEVVTAHATDTIHSVVTKMVAKHCGVIPIVDSEDLLVGVISLRDILMPMFASQEDVFHEDVHAMNFEEMEEKYPEVLKIKVEDIMTRNPLSVNPEYPLLRAATTMGLKHLRRIPVTENRKLCGVISVGDINRALYIAYEENISKAVNS